MIFNPSPITESMKEYPLDLVDTFILNEVEGEFFAHTKNPSEMLELLQERFPNAEILLTVGVNGSYYKHNELQCFVPSRKVEAVDTTGAGDTFCGFYIAAVLQGEEIENAMKRATIAASIAVTRPGASIAVPYRKEVDELLK